MATCGEFFFTPASITVRRRPLLDKGIKEGLVLSPTTPSRVTRASSVGQQGTLQQEKIVWEKIRRGNPVEINAASISQCQVLSQKFVKSKDTVRERVPCPKLPPPEPPPPKDDSAFWGTIAFLMLAGAFSAYAKDNKEIRDWLIIQAPWVDDIISILAEENCTILESIGYKLDEFKSFVQEMLEPYPPECLDEPPVIELPEVENVSNEIAAPEDDSCDDEDDDDDDDDEEDLGFDNIPPGYSQDPCVLEACVKDLGETIINNYETVRDACRYYNEQVVDTMDWYTPTKFAALEPMAVERKHLVKKHNCLAGAAMQSFIDLGRFIQCGCKAPADRLAVTRDMERDFKVKIERARLESIKEMEMAKAGDKLRKMIKATTEVFGREIQSMYSKINWLDERPNTGSGDIDYILIHTMKNIDSLKQQVAAAHDDWISRVLRGAEHYKFKEPKDKDKLKPAEPKAKADLDKYFSGKIQRINNENAADRQKRLDAQKKQFADTTAKRIQELEDGAAARIEEALANKPPIKKGPEWDQLKKKIAELEAKLEARATAEKESKRAQTLYAAALTIMHMLKRADRYIDITKELSIIEENSEGDNLVTTVLKTIPPDVKAKGITPETVLKKNYKSMEEVALKVAMLESEGAPLPMYWFSWLQYRMLMKPLIQPNTVPQVELDYPPQELDQFDSFDLLQRANYYIDQGKMSSAIRYVDALKGASRGAAETWYRDAYAHVHTRQACEAIVAHASAINLQYI